MSYHAFLSAGVSLMFAYPKLPVCWFHDLKLFDVGRGNDDQIGMINRKIYSLLAFIKPIHTGDVKRSSWEEWAVCEPAPPKSGCVFQFR